MALTESSIITAVGDWYRALDRHDPLADVLRFLVADGLEMRFPEATALGQDGFANWYKAVTNRFFDEQHTVTSVVVKNLTAQRADVSVVVNWQARIWDPPAPNSQWLGFDAYQTWEVVAGAKGTVLVKTYIVDSLEAMPGSASL
jgi:hypothetical protein